MAESKFNIYGLLIGGILGWLLTPALTAAFGGITFFFLIVAAIIFILLFIFNFVFALIFAFVVFVGFAFISTILPFMFIVLGALTGNFIMKRVLKQ